MLLPYQRFCVLKKRSEISSKNALRCTNAAQKCIKNDADRNFVQKRPPGVGNFISSKLGKFISFKILPRKAGQKKATRFGNFISSNSVNLPTRTSGRRTLPPLCTLSLLLFVQVTTPFYVSAPRCRCPSRSGVLY